MFLELAKQVTKEPAIAKHAPANRDGRRPNRSLQYEATAGATILATMSDGFTVGPTKIEGSCDEAHRVPGRVAKVGGPLW